MTDYSQFDPTVPYPNKDDFKTIKVIIDADIYDIPKGDVHEFAKKHSKLLGPITVAQFFAVKSVKSFKGAEGENIIVQAICDDVGYKLAQSNYRVSTNDGQDRFKLYLEEEHGTSKYAKKDALFQRAWADGHSSGFSAVDDAYYEFLVIIVY